MAHLKRVQGHALFYTSKAPVELDMIPVDKWAGGCKAVYVLIGRTGCIVLALLPKSRFPFASLNVNSST